MQPVKAEKEWKMMLGSDTGYTYLIIGRKGDVAIGIKPTAVMKGEAFNVPGNTWFGSKLRSVPAGDLFKEADAAAKEEKVVALKPKQVVNHIEAWPGVVWEQANARRASTTIGVMIRGGPDGTEAELNLFLEQVKGGKLARKMAQYLANLLGEENLTLPKEEIAEWFDGHYAKIVEMILEKIEQVSKMSNVMQENIGVFGMMSEILSKTYDKTKKGKKPTASDEPVFNDDGTIKGAADDGADEADDNDD